MNKKYMTPEMEIIQIPLLNDILADSKPQSSDVEIIEDPIDDDLFG